MKLAPSALAGMAIALAGCSGGDGTAQPTANDSAQTKLAEKKHPTYCFFKDAETKGWQAARDGSGNVVLTGKAHVKDARYKAVINESEISGGHVTAWLTISQNDGYAAAENWWDVSSTIPDSAASSAVRLQCGKKVVADLTIPK